MTFTSLVVAIAAALPAPGYTLADEATARDQFARWRSAVTGVARVAVKFRMVRLDFFLGSPPRTASNLSGVCYRDRGLWALHMVPAPISALDPVNGRRGRESPGIGSNPEVACSAISVVDGPEQLCYRFVNEPQSVDVDVPWFPASALSPENKTVRFFLSAGDWGAMFSPVRMIPIFWPTVINTDEYDIRQQIHKATGRIALTLEWKPGIREVRLYSLQLSSFDRLVAFFHEGSDVPHAIMFTNHSDRIHYYFDDYQTDESADIPPDAFELLDRE